METSKNKMLNIEKIFIRSVDTLPEKVIYVGSNQELTDLAGFWITLESSVLMVLTLNIMLDQATLHLRQFTTIYVTTYN